MKGYVQDIINRHYAEASSGLVNKAPSHLCRGEGVEKNFFILKIDLVNSTALLKHRQQSTYLKIAHTFLSTIDQITRDFGADGSQVEYAGDGVLAYFPEVQDQADKLLQVAALSRQAVGELAACNQTLRGLHLQCRIVLDVAPLIVAKIGPRGDAFPTAIGYPLHQVAKLEKTISPDVGRVTERFYQRLLLCNRKYLIPVHEAPSLANAIRQPPAQLTLPRVQQGGLRALSAGLGDSSSLLSQPTASPWTLGLLNLPVDQQSASSLGKTRFGLLESALHERQQGGLHISSTAAFSNKLVGYNLNWHLLSQDLGLN